MKVIVHTSSSFSEFVSRVDVRMKLLVIGRVLSSCTSGGHFMNFKSSADGPSSSIASAVGDSSRGKYFQYKSEIADEAEVLVNYLVALFYKKEKKSFLGS